jgi:hypothetical protein
MTARPEAPTTVIGNAVPAMKMATGEITKAQGANGRALYLMV